MILEIRQGILHIKIIVLPIGPDNHANGNMVLCSGVYDAAAEHPRADGRCPDWIAHSVNDPAGGELVILLGTYLYNLLYA
ncbi:hypothetical protein ES703_110166 [subsurface metagenome]